MQCRRHIYISDMISRMRDPLQYEVGRVKGVPRLSLNASWDWLPCIRISKWMDGLTVVMRCYCSTDGKVRRGVHPFAVFIEHLSSLQNQFLGAGIRRRGNNAHLGDRKCASFHMIGAEMHQLQRSVELPRIYLIMLHVAFSLERPCLVRQPHRAAITAADSCYKTVLSICLMVLTLHHNSSDTPLSSRTMVNSHRK